MEAITVDALVAVAGVQGYSWSRAEVEAIRAKVEQGLALVEGLSALPLRNVEPAVGYRLH